MELSKNKKKFFNIVDNFIVNQKISHAYLIEVFDYEDDFKWIKEFVKMILCNCKLEDLINDKSNISKLIDDDNYPDLKIIEADGQWIKRSQMLELQEEYHNKSILDNKRIYIIKEADKLNGASANTMLKFLEEPDDNIVAILLTKNRYRVLETILSRCQILKLNNDENEVEVDSDLIDLISLIVGREKLFIKYNEIYTNILPDKIVAKEKLEKIEKIFTCYLNYLNNEHFLCSNDIIKLLSKCDIDVIANYILIIEEEISKLEYNVNYKLWLDCLFARIILGGAV